MQRVIEHTAFAHRSFDDVCRILERHVDDVFSTATAAASQRSATLIDAADQQVPGFDSAESLQIRLTPLVRDKNHASIEFSWDANPTKRLLANVDARLDIRPLVKHGPAASTEIVLRAHYEPSAAGRRTPEVALFGRRVVKAALHRLLASIIESMDDYEENIFAM